MNVSNNRAVPSRPAHNPWFVGASVVIPTLIGVLDTTIAGRLVSRGIDARWLIVPGLLIMAAGKCRMVIGNPHWAESDQTPEVSSRL